MAWGRRATSPASPSTGSPPLSPFLSGQWPRPPWLSLLLLAPAVAAVVVGGGWRFAGVVLFAITLAIWISVLLRRRRLLSANARDYSQAADIRGEIEKVSTALAQLADARGSEQFTGLRLLDVNQHIASQIQTAVNGWLSHTLGLPSTGGRPACQWQGDAGEDFAGWSMGSLLSGAAVVAQFELADSKSERASRTLRVVIPAPWWAAECLNQAAHMVAAPLLGGTHSHDVLVASVGQAVARYPFPTNDVRRLNAFLRLPEAGRPGFSVQGASVGPGVVLAGAFRSTQTDRWDLIFPFALIDKLFEIAERHGPLYRFVSVYGTGKSRLVIIDR